VAEIVLKSVEAAEAGAPKAGHGHGDD
jgi:hypothetical protein